MSPAQTSADGGRDLHSTEDGVESRCRPVEWQVGVFDRDSPGRASWTVERE